MKTRDEEEEDEKKSEDWKQFAEYFQSKEGFRPTYGDSRAMMLFDYYAKGRFHEWYFSRL